MSDTASRRFWDKKKINFPFRIEVPHMSDQDLDPRYFNKLTRRPFLRVPFDGVAHWGFKTHEALVHFQKIAGIV